MTEPGWIEERDVLALHDRLIVLHGGAAGLIDEAGYTDFLRRNSVELLL